MTERPATDDHLEQFFAADRAAPPDASDALLTRVLADALAEQAVRAQASAAVQPGFGHRLVAVLRDLGGWPAVAGLVAATVAGLWIGISPPPALLDNAQGLWAADSTDYLVDIAPEDLFYIEEGATL